MTFPRTSDHRCISTLLIALAIGWTGTVAGCTPYRPIPVAPGVSFEAHLVRGGLLVDAMRDDDRTALAKTTPLSWTGIGHRPTLVMQEGPSVGESIWLIGPGRAVVRAFDSPDAPIVGRVDANWQDEAIRLVIVPARGPTLSSGAFVRAASGLGPSELSRKVERDDELYGAYRAPLRTPDGGNAGWFQMKLGDEQSARLIYEAVLPPDIDEGLAVASAAALGEELDWIQDHTLDAAPGMVDRP